MSEYIKLSRNAKDITGKRFGRLVALGPVGRAGGEKIVWRCRCDCGKETDVRAGDLCKGNTRSCGCLRREITSSRRKTHGMTMSIIYDIWQNAKTRCANPDAWNYANYGGRGIVVCREWMHDFQSFYDYVSGLPGYGEDGLQIDRINNDGNYEPGNVMWSSRSEQCRNRRNNVMLTHDGKTQCQAAWSAELGIDQRTISMRLRLGWTVERALTQPVRPQRSRKG